MEVNNAGSGVLDWFFFSLLAKATFQSESIECEGAVLRAALKSKRDKKALVKSIRCVKLEDTMYVYYRASN